MCGQNRIRTYSTVVIHPNVAGHSLVHTDFVTSPGLIIINQSKINVPPPPTPLMGNSLPSRPPGNTFTSGLWTPVFVFGPDATFCSGHGTVLYVPGEDKQTCVCDEGWTGLSDFTNAYGVQCHIHTWAIKGLWIVNLFLTLFVALYAAPRTWSVYKKHREIDERYRAKKKSYPIYKNKNLFTMIVTYIFIFPFGLATGLLRLTGDNRRIGTDVAMTICWIICRCGTYIGAAIQQPSLTEMMMKAESNGRATIERSVKVGYIISFFACCHGLWALPVLATQAQDVELSRACFALFCFGQMVTLLGLATQGLVIKRNLHEILTKSYNASQQKRDPNAKQIVLLRDLMVANQNKIIRTTSQQVPIYLILGCSPPLWIVNDWVLPILWLAPLVVAKQVIDSTYVRPGGSTPEEEAAVQMSSSKTSSKNNDLPPQQQSYHRGQRDEDADEFSTNYDASFVVQTPRHNQVESAVSSYTRPYETAFESKDVTSVLEVTENSPDLIAVGEQWMERKEERKKKRNILGF